MITLLMIRAGFPAYCVPMFFLMAPVAFALFFRDAVVGLFSFLNSILRSFWGFWESFIPLDYFYGDVIEKDGVIVEYLEPTKFLHFWRFFADARFGGSTGIPLEVHFMFFVIAIDVIMLIYIIRKANDPDPWRKGRKKSLKMEEAIAKRRYDD